MSALTLPFSEIVDILANGSLEMQGLLPWSSNYSFLMQICTAEIEIEAVYKPRRGERPLWDFSSGTLCQREQAAYLVSEALGWHLVPPTVLREGPHGLGSLQFFVEHNPEIHYFSFEGEYPDQLQKIVLFDAVINNADRKSGHVLFGEGERLWSIDHGICFHEESKLRSVIWEFAGQVVPPTLLDDMGYFLQTVSSDSAVVRQELGALLNERELAALVKRTTQLVNAGIFPTPGPGRYYPWPMV